MSAEHEDILGSADPFGGRPVEEVIALCRASGIRRLRYRGAEIEFSDNPGGSSPLGPEARQKFADDLGAGGPSDAEFLSWSAPEPIDMDAIRRYVLGAAGIDPEEAR